VQPASSPLLGGIAAVPDGDAVALAVAVTLGDTIGDALGVALGGGVVDVLVAVAGGGPEELCSKEPMEQLVDPSPGLA
jgi:hypothetical protein